MVYCDNISSVYMASNAVHHRRTKHIELDIHFVREKVAIGEVRTCSTSLSIIKASNASAGIFVRRGRFAKKTLTFCEINPQSIIMKRLGVGWKKEEREGV